MKKTVWECVRCGAPCDSEDDNVDNVANAKLIASAPELHAILNNLVIACKICGMSGALIRNAEEVLKKSRMEKEDEK